QGAGGSTSGTSVASGSQQWLDDKAAKSSSSRPTEPPRTPTQPDSPSNQLHYGTFGGEERHTDTSGIADEQEENEKEMPRKRKRPRYSF
ncbi:hypothetical protein F4804DRAFT_339619, partial [Jackrogersella minutella]